MSAKGEKVPQIGHPRGFMGRIAFVFMNRGHKDIYKNIARVLELRPEDDLVEVACGNGYFLQRYASHTRSIAGLDHSELAVELATKRNRDRVSKRTAEFVQGDASSLPWDDGRFSAATSMGSFLGFPKPMESLKEIHRVLGPGGRAVIGLEWNAEDGLDHTKRIEKYGMRMYTEAEARTMFEEVGFTDISFDYAKGFMTPKMMFVRGVKE